VVNVTNGDDKMGKMENIFDVILVKFFGVVITMDVTEIHFFTLFFLYRTIL